MVAITPRRRGGGGVKGLMSILGEDLSDYVEVDVDLEGKDGKESYLFGLGVNRGCDDDDDGKGV